MRGVMMIIMVALAEELSNGSLAQNKRLRENFDDYATSPSWIPAESLETNK